MNPLRRLARRIDPPDPGYRVPTRVRTPDGSNRPITLVLGFDGLVWWEYADTGGRRVKLSMAHYLETLATHGVEAREALIDQGYPDKVVLAKAEKASRKGYTDYGVAPDRGWLTDKGRAFLTRDTEDTG